VGHTRIAMAVIANGTAAASASRPSRAPRAADARTCSTKATASASESRIDILSRAYEPVTFDVNLMRGQSATFRHTLAPIMRTPQPAPGESAAGAEAAGNVLPHPRLLYGRRAAQEAKLAGDVRHYARYSPFPRLLVMITRPTAVLDANLAIHRQIFARHVALGDSPGECCLQLGELRQPSVTTTCSRYSHRTDPMKRST
jgi:hypothetical protein